MAEFSEYMEKCIIDLFRNIAFTEIPAYVALFTAATGTLESNNPDSEVAFAFDYARQLAGLDDPTTTGESENAADITFPAANGGNWGTITHIALVDHPTNTNWGTDVNVLMWSPLDASKTVDDGDTFKISAGDLVVTVA